MSINIESSKNHLTIIIRLSGVLEAKDYQTISEEIFQAAHREIKTVIFDVSQLKYFAVGGFLVLEKSLEQAQELGIELLINNPWN